MCGTWSFSRKQTISRKARGTFQKHLCHTLEDVTNCLFALPFLPPGCLRQRNLAGKSTSFDHACTSAPLRLLIYFANIVCVCIVHACMCVCVCVCLRVYVRVFMRACIPACMYVHVQYSVLLLYVFISNNYPVVDYLCSHSHLTFLRCRSRI